MAQGDDSAAGLVWLDLEHEQLRRGDRALHLRPKSLALLRYLVAHPGRLLSKDELVEAVWLQISEFPTGDFGSNRQAVSAETGRPFRSKAAPHRQGVFGPALANRRCGIDPILPWPDKASTFVSIILFW